MYLREHAGALVLDGGRFYEVDYALERRAATRYRDVLWSPGYFRVDLPVGGEVTLMLPRNHGMRCWPSTRPRYSRPRWNVAGG